MNLILDYKKVGCLLAEHRKRKGFRQKEVAKELGYRSSQFISNIERGVCTIPPDVLRSLFRTYALKPRERAQITQILSKEFDSALRRQVG